MTTRLLLICAANDGSGGFPADRPAATRQLGPAGRLAAHLPAGTRLFVAPDRAAGDTAAAAGLPGTPAPELAGPDFGGWAGQSVEAVAVADPQGLSAWIARPDLTPHGGEPLSQVIARTGAWMTGLTCCGGTVAAIAPAPVVRAAILWALGGGPAMAPRIDIPPLGLTRLTHDGRRWAWRASEP